MKAAIFDYVAPDTIGEVLDLLDEHGDEAQLIAGGQSLVPMMAFRLARPALLVDLNRVSGLDGLEAGEDHVSVGAMVRQRRILDDAGIARIMPALADATRLVGHYQTRNRGTIGGSIALNDPSAENPALALALDARLYLASKAGERSVAASDFFTGAYTTTIRPGELLTRIDYPRWAHATVEIDEITRRPGDFALSGLVVAIGRDSRGNIDRAGIVWFGMTSDPGRAANAEAMLIGQSPDSIDPRAVARQAVEDVEPKDDVQATAAYRRAAGLALATRLIGKALGRHQG